MPTTATMATPMPTTATTTARGLLMPSPLLMLMLVSFAFPPVHHPTQLQISYHLHGTSHL